MNHLSRTTEFLGLQSNVIKLAGHAPESNSETAAEPSEPKRWLSELLKPQRRERLPSEDFPSSVCLAAKAVLEPNPQPRPPLTDRRRSACTGNQSLPESVVVLASTSCSRLVSARNPSGQMRCLLQPIPGQAGEPSAWYQRELEFLKANESRRLLALKPNNSVPEPPNGDAHECETIIESVASKIERGYIFPASQAVLLLRKSLQALETYHQRGLIHGELNPGRLLCTADGRLVLFGSPGFQPEDHRRPLSETDLFAAPEVLNPSVFGKPSRSSDLYCLGHMILYAMLGKVYFSLLRATSVEAPTQAECQRWHALPEDQLPDLAELVPNAPPVFLSVIARLVTKPPSQRYQSINEALSDLSGVQGNMDSWNTAAVSSSGSLKAKPKMDRAELLPAFLRPVSMFRRPEPVRDNRMADQSSRRSRSALVSGLVLLLVGGCSALGFLRLSHTAPFNRQLNGPSANPPIKQPAEQPAEAFATSTVNRAKGGGSNRSVRGDSLETVSPAHRPSEIVEEQSIEAPERLLSSQPPAIRSATTPTPALGHLEQGKHFDSPDRHELLTDSNSPNLLRQKAENAKSSGTVPRLPPHTVVASSPVMTIDYSGLTGQFPDELKDLGQMLDKLQVEIRIKPQPEAAIILKFREEIAADRIADSDLLGHVLRLSGLKPSPEVEWKTSLRSKQEFRFEVPLQEGPPNFSERFSSARPSENLPELVPDRADAGNEESHAYLDKVERLLDSFRPKPYLSHHDALAPWFESTARKTDSLETSGVTPEIEELGSAIAQALRSVATRLREVSSGSVSSARSSVVAESSLVGKGLGLDLPLASPQVMSQHALTQIRDAVIRARRSLSNR